MKLSLRILLFLLILIWVVGILSEFFASKFPAVANVFPFIKNAYSLVCHQQNEKLIYFGNYETLVCARCFGIYLGFLASSFIFILINIKPRLTLKILIIAAIPMIIDVVATSFGIYSYSKPVAWITGFLLGSVGFLYFYKSLIQLTHEIKGIAG